MNVTEQIQEYIHGITEFTQGSKPRALNQNELPEKIYNILTTESHLARRPDPEFKKVIIGKIRQTIQEQKPLNMVLTVGGFKNYAARNAPHVDWAEVFAIKNMLNLCVPIAEIYQPGLHLEYSGDSYAVPLFDNMPKDTVDTYVKEFGEVLGIFQQFLPGNIHLSQKNIDEFYDITDLENRMKSWVAEVRQDQSKVDEYVEQFYQKAKNNFLGRGIIDYSHATEQEMNEVLVESILLDRAWLAIDIAERAEYLDGGLTIPLINTSVPGCIALKSVNMRKIAFWLGNGYLRVTPERVIPDIIHGTKFEELELSYADITTPFNCMYGFDTVPYLVTE